MSEQDVNVIIQTKVQEALDQLIKEAQTSEVLDIETIAFLTKFSALGVQKYLTSIVTLNHNTGILLGNDDILDKRTMEQQNAIINISQVTQGLLEKAATLQAESDQNKSALQSVQKKTVRNWRAILLFFAVVAFVGLAYLFAVIDNNWRLVLGGAILAVVIPYIFNLFYKSWKD